MALSEIVLCLRCRLVVLHMFELSALHSNGGDIYDEINLTTEANL